MNPIFEAVVYPFLFLALFFEVFLILTYFETESKKRRRIGATNVFPKISIIVPSYNEAKTLGQTVDSLLKLDYPKEHLDIILVNDGSTDGTAAIADAYTSNAHVRVLHKENGGKHTALNAGIAIATGEYVACLDADSFASTGALREIISHFDDLQIGAVTASMSIHRPRAILERVQQAEYLIGILLRHILSTMNGLHVTPGPFTVYRRNVFKEIGDFRSAHNTEDMEIALRMQKAGWKIQNAPRARVYTKAPKEFRALLKQRVRWTTGFIRNSVDYRELFGNPKHGALGMIVLPLGALSILASITLFIFSMVQLGQNTWDFGVTTSSVPLSYTLRLPVFDWFFVPLNSIIVLGALATIIAIAFVVEGARISKTRAAVGPALLWYIPLYGFIAPLWLIRAIIDVSFGIHRSWR